MAGELESLLSMFAQKRGMSALNSDDNGRYFFFIDSDLEMSLFQAGDRIYLQAELGPLPADSEREETLLTQLLRRNLVRLGKQNEVLSIAPETGQLVLFRGLQTRHLSFADFYEAMEDFVNALSFWESESNAVQQPPAAPPPTQMLFP